VSFCVALGMPVRSMCVLTAPWQFLFYSPSEGSVTVSPGTRPPRNWLPEKRDPFLL